LALARAEPQRCVIIDAAEPPEIIAAAVWRAVAERLLAGAG
jgi:dTMP kinase